MVHKVKANDLKVFWRARSCIRRLVGVVKKGIINWKSWFCKLRSMVYVWWHGMARSVAAKKRQRLKQKKRKLLKKKLLKALNQTKVRIETVDKAQDAKMTINLKSRERFHIHHGPCNASIIRILLWRSS